MSTKHMSTMFMLILCPCYNSCIQLMFIVRVLYQDKKKKYEPPIPTRVGKKQKKTKGPDAANKLPQGINGHLDSFQAESF